MSTTTGCPQCLASSPPSAGPATIAPSPQTAEPARKSYRGRGALKGQLVVGPDAVAAREVVSAIVKSPEVVRVSVSDASQGAVTLTTP